MVYATLHKAHHHHTAHHYLQQTRTHLPIEKAPKIITLIWFSGSNLILSLSFTSHFYFLSIFPPHLHRRWHGLMCLMYVWRYHCLLIVWLPVVGNWVRGKQSQCVCAPAQAYTPKSSHWNGSSSWKWLDIHIHIIKIKSIVQSMMGIERKKSAKGNSERDIVSEGGSEKKTPNPQYM